ncbi:MAG: NAD-dependent epimerase/dehydratase family protein [Actinomycetota bacterium]|nr:NAD-dependent epimerase/dehydratase family protein [Actinomycetota bacterium]
MRVVITGASGNVGTSVLRSFADEPAVDSVVGIARRVPKATFPKTDWVAADVRHADLVPLFEGADAVIHLAWLIQPSRDLATVRETNVKGSERVFQAVGDAGVPTLLYASSIGAYSPGPKDRAVDEGWPTEGIPTNFYSRHKAEVERLLDRFELASPAVRVVRLRKALIFKREAASGVRRLFMGPFVPTSLMKPERIPAIPKLRGVRFQCVHSFDVGEAYRLALTRDVRGPFNIAADPVLDFDTVAKLLEARAIPVPIPLVRKAAEVSWKLRLQPTPPGWVDLAVRSPVMDWSRARNELGWIPQFTSEQALLDLLAGLHDRDGLPTPPLSPKTSGPVRIREIRTGVGGR